MSFLIAHPEDLGWTRSAFFPNGYDPQYSDVLIEIYDENAVGERKPVDILKAHKLILSASRFLGTMLTSGMREGSESTIRLTTPYPKSLRKLLLCFYDHQMQVENSDELVELLYLVDVYEVPRVMEELGCMILPELPLMPTSQLATSSPLLGRQKVKITFENAPSLISCSGKLGLKLEAGIFSSLAQLWWEFGPEKGTYDDHMRNCKVLLESLDFCD